MKKLLSMFLACVLLLGILPTSAWAADSVEAALGEVDIYNGGYELGYLSINGAVKKQDYTYFMYKSNDGTTKEVPAYCVNPYLKGVPQKVEPGESIKYLAEERSSDPKVVGIIGPWQTTCPPARTTPWLPRPPHWALPAMNGSQRSCSSLDRPLLALPR